MQKGLCSWGGLRAQGLAHAGVEGRGRGCSVCPSQLPALFPAGSLAIACLASGGAGQLLPQPAHRRSLGHQRSSGGSAGAEPCQGGCITLGPFGQAAMAMGRQAGIWPVSPRAASSRRGKAGLLHLGLANTLCTQPLCPGQLRTGLARGSGRWELAWLGCAPHTGSDRCWLAEKSGGRPGPSDPSVSGEAEKPAQAWPGASFHGREGGGEGNPKS